MNEKFNEWIKQYRIRNGKTIREKYANQTLLYLSNIQSNEQVNLDEEYDKDKFESLIFSMEEKVDLGFKNRNTENGDRVALNKYAEFRQCNDIKSSSI